MERGVCETGQEDERNQPDYDPEVAAAEAAAAAISRANIKPQDIDVDTARGADLPAIVSWIQCVARHPFSLCGHDDQVIPHPTCLTAW